MCQLSLIFEKKKIKRDKSNYKKNVSRVGIFFMKKKSFVVFLYNEKKVLCVKFAFEKKCYYPDVFIFSHLIPHNNLFFNKC